MKISLFECLFGADLEKVMSPFLYPDLKDLIMLIIVIYLNSIMLNLFNFFIKLICFLQNTSKFILNINPNKKYHAKIKTANAHFS